MSKRYFALVAISCFIFLTTGSAQQRRPQPPPPDHADVRYGPHERNVFDLWQAESSHPVPLVIYYHGGGFRGGDKRTININVLRSLRAKGISVAAVNYRLSNVATYPAQMLDSARALQYIRLNAAGYGIDPKRVAAFGGSAGSGISQWLAYHDDLADPDATDPVLRQSTRLTAVAPYNAQSSYDPRVIMKLMNSNLTHEALYPFFGLTSDADIANPKFYPLFEDASPITHLTSDDPPILVFFSQRNDPLPPNSTGKEHIHHPKFGFQLKERADELGVECTLILREDVPDRFPVDRFVAFFVEKLRP